MHKLLLICPIFISFIPAAFAQFDEYEIWNGGYPKIQRSVQDYVKARREKCMVKSARKNKYSFHGWKVFCNYEDFDTLDWAYEELKNISQEIQKNKLERAKSSMTDKEYLHYLICSTC